jgi:hypothetical protein
VYHQFEINFEAVVCRCGEKLYFAEVCRGIIFRYATDFDSICSSDVDVILCDARYSSYSLEIMYSALAILSPAVELSDYSGWLFKGLVRCMEVNSCQKI